MVHAAIDVLQPGDVMVITTTRPADHAMFGDLLATSALAHGCRAVVVDAGVRDVADLRAMGFPVWAVVVHARGTVKTTPGSVNTPVACGGVIVHPGDVVVADDDGVVVVARKRVDDVLSAVRLRLEKEAEIRSRLAAGELGIDIYGFRRRLEEMGVRWVDAPGA